MNVYNINASVQKIGSHKFKKIFVLVLVFLVFFILPNSVFAATYYIDSVNGNDLNSGTSEATPWKTVKKVDKSLLNTGDDVLFKRGETFTDRPLVVHWSGSSSNRVIVGAYGSGNKPVLDMGGRAVIYLGSAGNYGYLTFENLELRNGGIGLSKDGSHNMIIRNLDIFDAYDGINVSKIDTFSITGCKITNSNNNGIVAEGSATYKVSNGIISNNTIAGVAGNDGITLHKDMSDNSVGSNFVISGNTMSGCAEQGIDINSGSSIVVENNTTHNNKQGSIATGRDSSDVIVRYNSSYDDSYNTSAGYFLRGTNITFHHNIGYGTTSYHQMLISSANGLNIFNNTFIKGAGVTFDVGKSLENVMVKNNIISGGTQIVRFLNPSRPPNYPTFDFNYNLYQTTSSSADVRHFYVGAVPTWKTFAQIRNSYGQESKGMETNPLFVNQSSNNFALKWNSPGIDSGETASFYTTTTTDYAGNPIYGTPDIGAYEYQPPYKIGVNHIPESGSIRIYSDGKYRIKKAPVSSKTINFSVTPMGGKFLSKTTQFMDISIKHWTPSEKQWIATSTSGQFKTHATTTVYTIGDLLPNTYYQFKIDGTASATAIANNNQCTNGVCLSDSSGNLSFIYVGGYSTHTFDLSKYTKVPSAPTDIIFHDGEFSWNTASSDIGIAQYKLYVDGILTIDNISPSVTSAKLTGTYKCNDYHSWIVEAVDNSGSVSRSDIKYFDIPCGAISALSNSKKVSTKAKEDLVVSRQKNAQMASSSKAVNQKSTSTNLTSSQVSSIILLLKAFGVNDSTIKNIKIILTKTSKINKQIGHISFETNLKFGDTNSTVKKLQHFLNSHNFLLSVTGPGSLGSETSYFGPATYRALIRYQKKHKLPSTGWFGPMTRKVVDSE